MFLLVAATFSTIYLTQPVLPVLREEFGIGAAAFGVFSSVFNYLPFHLAGPPFLLLIPVAAGLLEARADRPGRDFPPPGPA